MDIDQEDNWEPKVEIGVFADVAMPPGSGLTGHLFADLHNLVLCFGTESKQEKVKRFVFHTKHDVITITAATDKSNHSMVIIVGDMMSPNPLVIDAGKGGDDVPCSIFVDRRINAAILKKIISSADAQAEAKGGIKDGQRVDLCISGAPPKMEVAKIFVEPGACIPIIPQEGDTKETLMKRAKQTILSFDHPDQLAVLEHPISGISVICKNHLDYIKKREEITREVLKENGVKPGEVGGLQVEVLAALREQIDERLKEFREEYLADRERILPLSDKLQQDQG